MKKIFFVITTMLLLVTNVNAEDVNTSMIGFRPIVVTKGIPSNVSEYIENQVLNILTSEGIALSSGNFVFEISVNQLSKQITPTAPPQTQIRLEIVVKAIDKNQNIVLNSISISAAGTDNGESAAYMSAVRNVGFRNRNFMNFIEVSKSRLLAYYDAKTPNSEPQKEPVINDPKPEPIREPVVEDSPKNASVELSKGIFVEYLGVDKKSETTDVILRFTNCNDNDEVISFRGKTHMIVDSSGRNINSRSEKYLNGDDLPYNGVVLLKGVPVNIRVNYSGDITPQVMFLNEARRDVKVRIEIK